MKEFKELYKTYALGLRIMSAVAIVGVSMFVIGVGTGMVIA